MTTDRPRPDWPATILIVGAVTIAALFVAGLVARNPAQPHPCGAVMVSPDGTITIYGPAEIIDRQTGKRNMVEAGTIKVIR